MVLEDETRHFTVGGYHIELSRSLVEAKLEGTVAAPILKHAVSVKGGWYPVKHAIGLAAGIPRADVISTEARRVFRSLGLR